MQPVISAMIWLVEDNIPTPYMAMHSTCTAEQVAANNANIVRTGRWQLYEQALLYTYMNESIHCGPVSLM